jgi:DNA-binding CsgD family transcriptional regulator
MFDPDCPAPAALELLHSPQQLKRLLLDPQLGQAPAAMLDCGAHMILLAADFDRMAEPALAYLCRTLMATRCDTGLGAPGDAWFISSSQQVSPGAEVIDVVGLPLPNGHWVPQTSWASPRPTAFELSTDPRCADLLRVPALAESRRILVRRLEYAQRAVGQLCADQVLDLHPWRDGDLTCMESLASGFLSPLAYLHGRSRMVPRRVRPTAAELRVIALVAEGLSYKQVAARLGRSVRTVSNQLTSARERLGVHNERQLVRACRAWLETIGP